MKLSRFTPFLLPFMLFSVNNPIFAAENATATSKNAPKTTSGVTRKKQNISKPGYTYAGVNFISQNLDYTPSCTQSGIQLYGSLYIQKGWFAEASYGDVSGSSCGSSRVTAGGGYKAYFNDQFDMYGTLQFETISPDNGASHSGLILTGGLRGFVTQELEAVFELAHSTSHDGSTSIKGGGRYWFSNGIAATADLGLSADYVLIQLGVRMLF